MHRNGLWAVWIVVVGSRPALGEPTSPQPDIKGPHPPVEATTTPVIERTVSDDQWLTVSDDQWLRSTSAFENRSVEIAQTAQNIQLVVQDIQESARLSRLTQLSTLTIHLDREIGRAKLASEYIDKP